MGELSSDKMQELREILESVTKEFLLEQEEDEQEAEAVDVTAGALQYAMARGDWKRVDELARELEQQQPARDVDEVLRAGQRPRERGQEYEALTAELSGLVQKVSLGKQDAARMNVIHDLLNEIDPPETLR